MFSVSSVGNGHTATHQQLCRSHCVLCRRFYDIFIQDNKCQILAEVRAGEDVEWHQHLAGGQGSGFEQMSPIPPRGSGGRDPRIFLYIFNTRFCILMHSLAPKMDTISVLSMHWERKTVERGCQMRPEGRDRGGVHRKGAASPTS